MAAAAIQSVPNINELLPGCKPWSSHFSVVAGGRSDGNEAENESESIRRHPASSLLFLANQEARAWNIVEEIKRGVRESDFHLRTRISVHALKRHLDLKRSVSRQARVEVIKLLYTAITDAGLDQMLQRGFAKVLCRLLKIREENPLDLSLDWRPLYHLIDRLLFGKARTPQTPLCRNLPYYAVLLAKYARRYFDEGSNEEILKELRPCYCPQDMSLLRAQGMLCLLLVRQAPNAAECVNEIFAMWSWIVSYIDWDLHWMQLLAALCRHTYREQHQMWEQYIPRVFSHVLHCLDLPVGPTGIHMYDSKESSIGHSDGYPLGSLSVLVHKGSSRTKSLQLVNKASKLIVYLLRPRGERAEGGEAKIRDEDDEAGAMAHLRRLAKAVESFIHPSNGGYWTRRLTHLLASLCHHLRDRVKREAASDAGKEIALQQSDLTEFVNIVMPLCMQALYSKNAAGMMQACVALKDLAFLDSNAVLPSLLDRIYAALTTLTEVHQASAALEALSSIIYPLIRLNNFPAGATHLPNIMNLTLSGIDLNDCRKTWATLRFYAILLSGLPLISIDEGPVPDGCDPLHHQEALQALHMLSDWPLRFLDQTFVFMMHQGSSQPQMEASDDANKGDRETRTSDYLLQCALEVCFMQMDEGVYHKAVQKVADLCFTNLLYQQQAQLGVLLTGITAVDPAYVVNKFVPLCLRILLEHSSTSTPRINRSPSGGRTPFRTPGTAGTPKPISPWNTAAAIVAADSKGPQQCNTAEAGAGAGVTRGVSGGAAGASSTLPSSSVSCSSSPPGGGADNSEPRSTTSARSQAQSPKGKSGTPLSASLAKGEVTLAALSETELVYYLYILEQVAQVAGDAMCKHKDKLHAVLDAAVKVEERAGVKSRKVIKAAMHLLRALLTSLVTFRPKESRSVPAHMWNDPVWRRSHYQSWGHVVSLADVEVEWRGPSQEGLQWAADLQARYLAEPLLLLRAFLKQEDGRGVPPPTPKRATPAAPPTPPAPPTPTPADRVANSVASADTVLNVAPLNGAGKEGGEGQRSGEADGQGGGGAEGGKGGGEGGEKRGGGAGGGEKRMLPPGPLTIPPEQLTSSLGTPRSTGGSVVGGVCGVSVTATEATAAVVQICMVTQGLAYVQPPWDASEEEEVEVAAEGLDHASFKAAFAHLTSDGVPDLVSLPPPSQGSAAVSRREVAELLQQVTSSVLARRGEDVKFLQALAKALDSCLNGVDVMQKKVNRLRIRYTLIKSQFTEKDGLHKLMPRCLMVARIQHHHMSILMQRQRKLRSTALVNSLLSHVTVLSTYHYRSVRVKAQPALISCTRRYNSACSRLVPMLVGILEDTSNSGHVYEQAVVGAANLLQTGVLSKRILRDWGMMRRFFIALCRSDHLDKVSVHAVLVDLFNTFQSALYQIELTYPRYAKWIEAGPTGGGVKGDDCGAGDSGVAGSAAVVVSSAFHGHTEMQGALVDIFLARPNLHWRYKFMIIGTLATMLRDDQPASLKVWEALLSGLISDISHLRKLCFRAVSTALELLQTTQQSKEDEDGMQRVFPDKNLQLWNGRAATAPIKRQSCRARAAAVTQEYRQQVLNLVRQRFSDEGFMESLTNLLSLVQSARAKHFVGSLAQMWKALFKALGLPILDAVKPFLSKVVSEKDGHAKLSTDVYLGQQCMAAEIVSGLVRGIKYWPPDAQLLAKHQVRAMIDFTVSIPEMESAGVWASALRFAIFDRHPTRISWLMVELFDAFPPFHKDANSTLVCRRISLLKPLINELSWRGGPLSRQLLHDVAPYLASPFTQTREYAASCVGLISRVTWGPPSAHDQESPPCTEVEASPHKNLPLTGHAPLQPAGVGQEKNKRSNGGSNGSGAAATAATEIEQEGSVPRNVASAHVVATESGCRLTPEIFTTRARIYPSEVLHHMVSHLCARISFLSHKIYLAKQEKEGGGSEGGGGGGEGGRRGLEAGDNGANMPAAMNGGEEVDMEVDVEARLSKAAQESCNEDKKEGKGSKEKERDKKKDELKQLEDEVKHLRHSLFVLVSNICPFFDGMYTCPLAAHLPALLLPLLQAMEDRDPDLSAQAKRCGELSANTPMLSPHVLEQALAAVYLLGESKSWQVRSGVLRFLQIIAFRHQFLMGKHGQLARIRDLMLSLLQDSQVEVRETASAAVAVLVRICGEHLSLQLMADFKSWAQQQIPNTTAAIHQAPDFVTNSRETERRTFGEWTHKATSENTCENGSALGARTRLTQDADLSPATQDAHDAGVDSRSFDSRACALACSGSAGTDLTEDGRELKEHARARSTAALALHGTPHVGTAHVMGGMPRAATHTSQASRRNATEEVKREEEKPQEGNREEDKEAVKAAILRRHAGVLGLAALVGAYPYDVPAWMPEILVLLAQHVLDPMPIKQTVRKTFGEFWRTHQDTWPMLKVRFSEDDLNTLTNLLASPSYFS